MGIKVEVQIHCYYPPGHIPELTKYSLSLCTRLVTIAWKLLPQDHVIFSRSREFSTCFGNKIGCHLVIIAIEMLATE